MRLFRQFYYASSKKETIQVFFDRVKSVLNDIDSYNPDILFYFSDHFSENWVSAIERIKKKLPQLAVFQYLELKDFGSKDQYYKVISNLPESWKESNKNKNIDNVSLDLIEAVVKGIPRSFPLNDAKIIFDRVDWYKNENKLLDNNYDIKNEKKFTIHNASDYLVPSIIISSDWWINGRMNYMIATVEIDVPNYSEHKLPNLDEQVIKRLSMLGKIKCEMLSALPSDEEKEKIALYKNKANSIVADVEKNFNNLLREIDLPFNPNEILNEIMNKTESISPKRTIINFFNPIGYSYLSNLYGQGVYYIVKRTPKNNQITLEFETGKFKSDLSCNLYYEGPFCKHRLRIQLSNNPPDRFSYSIYVQSEVEKIIANIRAIVLYLEKTLISELDDIYGEAPNWYEYQR